MNGLLLQQAGQGDAFILPATNSGRIAERLDQVKMEKRRKALVAEQAKKQRDQRLNELMKWNPDQAWYPQTEQLNKKVANVYDYATQLKLKGSTTPEEERRLKELQWDAETTAKKSEDLKGLYSQVRQQISSQDKYTNKDYLYSKLNDWAFGDDGQKDVNEIDFESINNIYNDPMAFNVRAWSDDFAKSLPDSVESQIATLATQGGTLIQDKEIKSKFFDVDDSGRIKKDSKGNPIIKITPETTNLAMQEPRFKMFVESELAKPENQYKTPSDVVREVLSPYAMKQEKVSVSKGFTNKEGGNDDDVTFTTTNDVERNFNLSQDPENPNIKAGWIPKEVRLGGKKMDKTIRINAKRYVDEDTNKFIDEQIGDREIKITRLQLRPTDPKTGRLLINNKGNVLKNKNGVVYKWYVAGSYQQGDKEDPETKNILIPYDDVAPDLKSAYGIDLSSMDVDDPLGITISEEDPLGILK